LILLGADSSPAITMKYLIQFLYTSILAFIVASIVSFLYGLIAHGAGVVDWGTAARLALILGIIFPILSYLERKKKSTSDEKKNDG